MGKLGALMFIIVLTVALLSVIFVTTDLENAEGNQLTSFVIKNNIEGDFPDSNQGTFLYRGNLNREILKINDSNKPDYIVIFYSRKIPGLAMKYNLKDNTIEAGLPVIKSPPIDLLNNETYEFIYTFRKDDLQVIFINDKEIIASPYTGTVDTMITGFVTRETDEVFEEKYVDVEMDFQSNFFELNN